MKVCLQYIYREVKEMYSFLDMETTRFGEKDFLSYQVKVMESIDTVEVGMMKNNNLSGLLPFSDAQNNDAVTLMYDITRKITLKQFFGGVVRWEDLSKVFGDIATILADSERYMMNPEHFLLSEEQIYVDVQTREPQILFIPLENETESMTTWRQFMLNVLNSITYDSRDSDENLAALRTLIIDDSISLSQFSKKVLSICGENNKENVFVPSKENEENKSDMGGFIPNPVIENMEKSRPKFNVPSDVVSDFGTTQKKKKTKGSKGLFRKKKTPVSDEFEIPGQEKVASFPKSHGKRDENQMEMSQIQDIAATELIEEEISVFRPMILEKSTGKSIAIDKPEFRIGREPGVVEHLVTNQTVGRLHASIVLDNIGKKAFIRDANSKNGTYVDGKRIQSNINVPLENGVSFRLGKEEFLYREK